MTEREVVAIDLDLILNLLVVDYCCALVQWCQSVLKFGGIRFLTYVFRKGDMCESGNPGN